MAKRESNFINMVATLFIVTLVAAAALGFVYDLTKDAIEVSKMKAQNEAIAKVLPAYEHLGDSYKMPADEPGADSLEFFPAYNGDELVGVAIKTYTKKGFGGLFTVMVGIDKEGNFSGYEVLEHSETPGLGSKMTAWFKNADKPKQYVIGKNPDTTKFQVSKDGGEIDAMTASTITSRAFLDALNRAYHSYKQTPDTTSGATTINNQKDEPVE